MSNRPAPDVASDQPAGVVSFPPLQTYSDEESMMREAGELVACVPLLLTAGFPKH